MATALPARSIFDGTGTPTTSAMKNAMGLLRDYLAEQLGTTGGAPTAIASINGGQLAGMRSKIMNGNAVVAQRGNVAIPNNTKTYGGADRIYGTLSGFTTASGTMARAASGAGAGFTTEGFQYAQGIQSLTTTGSGSVFFGQPIESINAQQLTGKTVTISAWVLHDVGSSLNYVITLTKANSTDNFGTETTIGTSGTTSVATSTWTKLTYTLTLGANDALTGLDPQVIAQSVGAVTSKNFYITGFQLEVGSVATPFEQRPYGLEEMLCKRYLPTWKSSSTVDMQALGFVVSATSASFLLPYVVTPRVNPSGLFVSSASHLTVNSNGGGGVASAMNFADSSLTYLRATATQAGMTAGQAVQLYFNSASGLMYGTGCEL